MRGAASLVAFRVALAMDRPDSSINMLTFAGLLVADRVLARPARTAGCKDLPSPLISYRTKTNHILQSKASPAVWFNAGYGLA